MQDLRDIWENENLIVWTFVVNPFCFMIATRDKVRRLIHLMQKDGLLMKIRSGFAGDLRPGFNQTALSVSIVTSRKCLRKLLNHFIKVDRRISLNVLITMTLPCVNQAVTWIYSCYTICMIIVRKWYHVKIATKSNCTCNHFMTKINVIIKSKRAIFLSCNVKNFNVRREIPVENSIKIAIIYYIIKLINYNLIQYSAS